MTVANEADYQAALLEFTRLATADQHAHQARLIELRNAIDAYEIAQGQEPPLPSSFCRRLELEMFQRHLKQKDLADLLEIPYSRLSEYLNGKRKPNLALVKKLHTTLRIPGDELLALV